MAYLTRKDFVLRASIVAQEQDAQRREIEAYRWAHIFNASNPRFDFNKFLRACGAKR